VRWVVLGSTLGKTHLFAVDDPGPHPTPSPYTLHPTPYTLHPTPYTLHPTPYTLLPSLSPSPSPSPSPLPTPGPNPNPNPNPNYPEVDDPALASELRSIARTFDNPNPP